MAFKIYTRTGDQGETSLFGGKRLPKDHLRIESYGTVDELNSHVGLLRDQIGEQATKAELKGIQDLLFTIGSNLAVDPEKDFDMPGLQEGDVDALEKAMDRMDKDLPELKNFILPGGHVVVSQAHVARCVCRRAERLIVALSRHEPVDVLLLQYLNRLSDYLFTMARYQAHRLGVEEVVWAPRS